MAVLLVVALMTAAGCSGDGALDAPRTTQVRGTIGNDFEPRDILVAAGATVTWTWEGTHDVRADDGTFTSGEPMADGTFEHTFDAAGTYRYFCTLHGQRGGVGMAGAVIVEEP